MDELNKLPEESAELTEDCPLEQSESAEELLPEDSDAVEDFSIDDDLAELLKEPEEEPDADAQPNKPAQLLRRILPRTRMTFYALILIFLSVFLLCGVYLGKYFSNAQNSANQYDQLASIRDQATEQTTDPTVPSNDATLPTGETQPPEMLPDMKAIYELNNDLVGWIKLPELKIDYPVMQTPDSRDYYLYRDFYRQDNDTGCLYVRETCDVFKPSDNVVIYGHAMKTGDMFGRLYNYRSKAYWEEHQYFTFDTLYERHTYQIFAVFITSGTQRDENGNPVGYPYHRLNDFADAAAFDQFIADIKGAAFKGENTYVGKSLFDTGITPTYGDKLVCLSTCEYTIDNGRLVIMGVQID